MTEQMIGSKNNHHEGDLGNEQTAFKAANLIQNDHVLSLLYFCLIIFLPLVIWNHVDRILIYQWQGVMITLSAARWFCRTTYTDINNKQHFWNKTFNTLILLDGLGWGIMAAVLFSSASTLTMSLTALLLIGIGAVGAASYSSKMLIAIPYLLCVSLPYTTRLFVDGGNDQFMIATALGLLITMFSFTTDRLNFTLNYLLKTNHQDKKIIQKMKDEIYHMKMIIKEIEIQSKNPAQQIIYNTQEGNNVAPVKQQSRLDQNKYNLTKIFSENTRHLSNSSDIDKTPTDIRPILPTSPESIRILIVNNDLKETRKIEASLHDPALEFQSVSDVSTALAILCQAESDKQCFDLVIANLWIPEMVGVNFAECLHDDPDLQKIKLILISPSEPSIEENPQNNENILVLKKSLVSTEIPHAINSLTGMNISTLPTPIGDIINNALQSFNLPTDDSKHQNDVSLAIIDRGIIENLRSSKTTSFIEVINDYLEAIPQLIEQAKMACSQQNFLQIQKIIKDLDSRSNFIGVSIFVKTVKTIQEFINNNAWDQVMDMLDSIDNDFTQVEAALLAELTDGILLVKELKY